MEKIHRVVFPLSNKKIDFPFSLIHTDVWDPAPQSTHNGKNGLSILFMIVLK